MLMTVDVHRRPESPNLCIQTPTPSHPAEVERGMGVRQRFAGQPLFRYAEYQFPSRQEVAERNYRRIVFCQDIPLIRAKE